MIIPSCPTRALPTVGEEMNLTRVPTGSSSVIIRILPKGGVRGTCEHCSCATVAH